MRTELIASSQSGRSIDADAWCKQAQNPSSGIKFHFAVTGGMWCFRLSLSLPRPTSTSATSASAISASATSASSYLSLSLPQPLSASATSASASLYLSHLSFSLPQPPCLCLSHLSLSLPQPPSASATSASVHLSLSHLCLSLPQPPQLQPTSSSATSASAYLSLPLPQPPQSKPPQPQSHLSLSPPQSKPTSPQPQRPLPHPTSASAYPSLSLTPPQPQPTSASATSAWVRDWLRLRRRNHSGGADARITLSRPRACWCLGATLWSFHYIYFSSQVGLCRDHIVSRFKELFSADLRNFLPLQLRSSTDCFQLVNKEVSISYFIVCSTWKIYMQITTMTHPKWSAGAKNGLPRKRLVYDTYCT